MRRIKQFIFRGKKYIIRWRKIKEPGLGLCDPPFKANKTITLHSKLKGQELLRVAIDEAIHACFWDLDNASVAEASESISDFLHAIGFRDENEVNNV